LSDIRTRKKELLELQRREYAELIMWGSRGYNKINLSARD
jgi:hypothetical protein